MGKRQCKNLDNKIQLSILRPFRVVNRLRAVISSNRSKPILRQSIMLLRYRYSAFAGRVHYALETTAIVCTSTLPPIAWQVKYIFIIFSSKYLYARTGQHSVDGQHSSFHAVGQHALTVAPQRVGGVWRAHLTGPTRAKKEFGLRAIETGRLSCPAKRHVEDDTVQGITLRSGVCACILTLQVRCTVLRWSGSSISSVVLPRGKLSRIPRATTAVGFCAIRPDLSCRSPTTSNLMAVGWCVTVRKCLRKTSKIFFFFAQLACVLFEAQNVPTKTPRLWYPKCTAFRGKTMRLAAAKPSFTNRGYAAILSRVYRHGVQILRAPNVSVVDEIIRRIAAVRNDRPPHPRYGKVSRKARVGNGRRRHLSDIIFHKTTDIKRPLFKNKKLFFSYIFENAVRNGDRRCVDETICTNYM